jgi:hypothetical protein
MTEVKRVQAAGAFPARLVASVRPVRQGRIMEEMGYQNRRDRMEARGEPVEALDRARAIRQLEIERAKHPGNRRDKRTPTEIVSAILAGEPVAPGRPNRYCPPERTKIEGLFGPCGRWLNPAQADSDQVSQLLAERRDEQARKEAKRAAILASAEGKTPRRDAASPPADRWGTRTRPMILSCLWLGSCFYCGMDLPARAGPDRRLCGKCQRRTERGPNGVKVKSCQVAASNAGDDLKTVWDCQHCGRARVSRRGNLCDPCLRRAGRKGKLDPYSHEHTDRRRDWSSRIRSVEEANQEDRVRCRDRGRWRPAGRLAHKPGNWDSAPLSCRRFNSHNSQDVDEPAYNNPVPESIRTRKQRRPAMTAKPGCTASRKREATDEEFCLGIWFSHVLAGLTPPSIPEIAETVGCHRGYAHRVLARVEGLRKGIAKVC